MIETLTCSTYFIIRVITAYVTIIAVLNYHSNIYSTSMSNGDPNRKLLRQKSEFTTIDNISALFQAGPHDVEETPSSLEEGLL